MPRKNNGLILLQKVTINTRGGKKNYDNADFDDDDDDDDDYDDNDDDDDDYNEFLSSQRTSNRVGTRGSR